MRGIFAAGVLDVFLEQHFDDFDFAIGASAGACNLASHLASQHGRNRRCYLTQMRRTEFIDARRFLRGGHWLDIDYLWDAFDREDPLDVVAAAANRTRLVIAATSVDTGLPEYFTPTAETLSETLRASSAVPVLFRRFVELDTPTAQDPSERRRFTDGGISAPIPVEAAYRRGARRIIVIRSRPADFPGPSRAECAFAMVMLYRQPALAAAFARYRAMYATARAFIANPPHDCRIVHVAPPPTFQTTRTTRDVSVLERDYEEGRRAAARAMHAWSSLSVR